jgi:hypothetical protein
LIFLREKGETVRWQPVSPTLMAHLRRHAEHHDAPPGGKPLGATTTSGRAWASTCPGWRPSRSARTGCATPP